MNWQRDRYWYVAIMVVTTALCIIMAAGFTRDTKAVTEEVQETSPVCVEPEQPEPTQAIAEVVEIPTKPEPAQILAEVAKVPAEPEDKPEYYKPAEPIVETDIEDYIANYDLLRGVVLAEARGEGYEGMRAVATVIYYRVYYFSEIFGNDLYSVLTDNGQFAKPFYSDAYPDVDKAIEAVFALGEFTWDYPVDYFYNPRTASSSGAAFLQSKQYVGTLGHHEFRTEWSVDIDA